MIGLSSIELEREVELGFLLEGPSLPRKALTFPPFSPSFSGFGRASVDDFKWGNENDFLRGELGVEGGKS